MNNVNMQYKKFSFHYVITCCLVVWLHPRDDCFEHNIYVEHTMPKLTLMASSHSMHPDVNEQMINSKYCHWQYTLWMTFVRFVDLIYIYQLFWLGRPIFVRHTVTSVLWTISFFSPLALVFVIREIIFHFIIILVIVENIIEHANVIQCMRRCVNIFTL